MRFVLGLAAAAALAVAAPAHAGSSATALLGPLAIELVDLDPLDGIAPSIQFEASSSSRAAVAAFTPFGVFDDDVQNGTGPWGDTAAGVLLPLAQAAASLSGAGPDGTGAVLSAHGSAFDFDAPAGQAAQYQGAAWAPYVAAGAFTLSAATAVTISGAASVDVATTSGSAYYHDFASAFVHLYITGVGGSGMSFDSLSASCESITGSGPCFSTDGRTLTATFSNTTAASISGNLQAAVQAAGYTYASAVPEPGAWALLLAGLAGLRFAATRSRVSARP